MNSKIIDLENDRADSADLEFHIKGLYFVFMILIGLMLSACSSQATSGSPVSTTNNSSNSSTRVSTSQGNVIGVKHGNGPGSAEFYLTKNEMVNFKVSCSGSGTVSVEITQPTGKSNPPINAPYVVTSCNNKTVEVGNGPFYSIPTSKNKYFLIASVDTNVGVPWTFTAYSA